MTDNLVTLTIDGRTVRVPRGTLLVDAAKSVGIIIPVFCYHEKMKPVGACRMCLVEISPGPPLPQTACTSPVAEGMVVKTRSPMAVSAQKATVEFLLLNHPLDCPVCDRGGECPLQDNTFGFGGAESRYLEEKRHFEKPLALSAEVLLDRERCIMCYRCVRFTREIAGDESLGVIERGTESQIGLAPGRTFDSPFSGNTIEICPVGALTSSRYRFVARPWDIKSVATICPHCPVGCNVRADVRNNEIKRFLGRENAPVDDGWLCDRGRFGYEFPHSPDRLTQPMVRRDGQLQPATWAEAIEAVRAGLAGRDPASVAGLAGSQLTNEDLFMFRRLIREQIGSPNLDHTTTPHPVSAAPPKGSIGAIERSDVVVLVGVDLEKTHPVLYLRLRKAAGRGARFVVIGPDAQHFEELKRAAQHLPAQAGEEAGVIGTLLPAVPGEQDAARERRRQAAEAAADRAFADAVKRAHDAAVAKAKEANEPDLAPYATPAEGGERYGITRNAPAPQREPAVDRLALLHALAEGTTAAPGATATTAPGPSHATASRTIGGAERVTIIYYRSRSTDPRFERAVQTLAQITEAPNVLPLVMETNEQGALDLDVLPSAAPNGPISAMYLAGRDAEIPASVEFLVVQHHAHAAAMQRANVVLPGQTFAEKEGTYTNLERRVQRLRVCREAPGEARPDWRIFRDVANALGGGYFVNKPEDVFREIPAYAELSYGKIGFKGAQLP